MRSRCGRQKRIALLWRPTCRTFISIKPRLSRTGSTTAGTTLSYRSRAFIRPITPARALAATLRGAGLSGLTAVIGILDGKQPEEMLSALAPCFARVYTVRPDSPRALSAEALAALAKRHFPQVTACDSVEQALRLARGDAPEGLVVCGSLYLAAQARGLLTK